MTTRTGPTDAPVAAGGHHPSAGWPVWRAHRVALLTAAATLAVGAGGLIVLRVAVDRAIDRAAPGQWCPDLGGCAGSIIAAGLRVGDVVPVMIWMLLALPTVTGSVLGAVGVAREAERGTMALALTQGVSPGRWWVTTVAVLAGPLALAWAGLGLLAVWAFAPLRNYVGGLLTTPYFETRGPVLGAYFLLAFVTAAALGVWRRTTVVALVGSVLGCAVLVLLGLGLLRPHYAEPSTVTRPLADSLLVSGRRPDVMTWRDWQLRVAYVTDDGRTMDSFDLRCSGEVPDEPAATFWNRCLAADGFIEEVTVFHSAGQWPRFQATESVLVLSLSAVVGWLGLRRIRRNPR